jgi:hypothetical protein
MSTLAVNTITNAAGGNTAQINGMTPTADSLQGFRNRLINSDMRIDQRNAGASVGASPLSGVYTLDRWLVSRTGTGNNAVQRVANTNYGGQFAVSLSGAFANGEALSFEQRIEAANCFDLAGQTVTVSFRHSETTSAGSVAISVSATYAGASDNWTSETLIATNAITVSSTATSATTQFTVPSAAVNGIKLRFNFVQGGATGNIQAFLGGVQLEAGSVATPFERRPYGTELALCQRYYWTGNSTMYGYYGFGPNVPEGSWISFPVTMRIAPTVTFGTALTASATNFESAAYIATNGFFYAVNVTATATAARVNPTFATSEL